MISVNARSHRKEAWNVVHGITRRPQHQYKYDGDSALHHSCVRADTPCACDRLAPAETCVLELGSGRRTVCARDGNIQRNNRVEEALLAPCSNSFQVSCQRGFAP